MRLKSHISKNWNRMSEIVTIVTTKSRRYNRPEPVPPCAISVTGIGGFFKRVSLVPLKIGSINGPTLKLYSEYSTELDSAAKCASRNKSHHHGVMWAYIIPQSLTEPRLSAIISSVIVLYLMRANTSALFIHYVRRMPSVPMLPVPQYVHLHDLGNYV